MCCRTVHICCGPAEGQTAVKARDRNRGSSSRLRRSSSRLSPGQPQPQSGLPPPQPAGAAEAAAAAVAEAAAVQQEAAAAAAVAATGTAGPAGQDFGTDTFSSLPTATARNSADPDEREMLSVGAACGVAEACCRHGRLAVRLEAVGGASSESGGGGASRGRGGWR